MKDKILNILSTTLTHNLNKWNVLDLFIVEILRDKPLNFIKTATNINKSLEYQYHKDILLYTHAFNFNKSKKGEYFWRIVYYKLFTYYEYKTRKNRYR